MSKNEMTIGDYTIRRLNIDYLEVEHRCLGKTAVLCVGDMETVLSTLFVDVKLKRTSVELKQ